MKESERIWDETKTEQKGGKAFHRDIATFRLGQLKRTLSRDWVENDESWLGQLDKKAAGFWWFVESLFIKLIS